MCFTDEPGTSVLEEAFNYWLERYRESQPDGLLVSQFLTREHLMAAFAAGVAAHAEVAGVALVREAGRRAWELAARHVPVAD